jgi:hypothetical protein
MYAVVMKTVILHGSQLFAVVPDEQVFERPQAETPGAHDTAHDAEDQKARYAAWAACEGVTGGARVYTGVCAGGHVRQLVYVVLPTSVYDERRQPRSVPTKDDDEARRVEAEQERVAQERKQIAAKRQDRVRASFEIIPKEHAGVNYGAEQRVLIRTKTHILTWLPGSTGYIGRGERHYAPGTLSMRKITVDKKHRDKLGYVVDYSAGRKQMVLPKDFRFALKNLLPLYPVIEKALGLPAGALRDYKADRTLVLA